MYAHNDDDDEYYSSSSYAFYSLVFTSVCPEYTFLITQCGYHIAAPRFRIKEVQRYSVRTCARDIMVVRGYLCSPVLQV